MVLFIRQTPLLQVTTGVSALCLYIYKNLNQQKTELLKIIWIAIETNLPIISRLVLCLILAYINFIMIFSFQVIILCWLIYNFNICSFWFSTPPCVTFPDLFLPFPPRKNLRPDKLPPSDAQWTLEIDFIISFALTKMFPHSRAEGLNGDRLWKGSWTSSDTVLFSFSILGRL